MKRIIKATLLTLLFASFSTKLYGTEPPFISGIIKPSVRVEAPAFTLTSLDGSSVKLSDFENKVILLNFWATWCAPCTEEMPDMERLWKTLGKKDLVIIAIAQDRGSPKAVRKFSKKHRITFPILLDPTGRVREAYEVTGLPISYIIRKDKKISGKIIGKRDWDGAESIEFFKTLLGKNSG